jgi:Cu+-exporting ATPase
MALVQDVVCGMQIESSSAAGTSEYNGATYYFCAPGCKRDFDANPEKYLDPSYVANGMPAAKPSKRWWEFWKS